MSRFVAIDVETANADYASICQVGVAMFEENRASRTWDTLVDPEDYFDGMNISIHGISPEDVVGAPTFPEIFPRLSELIGEIIVVHHTHFDRTAIKRASSRYGLDCPECQWLDSARVVRRVWKEFAERGYGLQNVATSLGISFEHHDALEDALACGKIFLEAVEQSSLTPEEWLTRVEQPISSGATYADSIVQDGDPSGPLYGETVVFTGKLSVPRRTAAEIAAQAGGGGDCGVGVGPNSAGRRMIPGLRLGARSGCGSPSGRCPGG